MVTLNPYQEEAFKLVKDGHSICLTGSGGSGKTFMIRHILQELQLQESQIKVPTSAFEVEKSCRRRIAVTAMTGIASTYITGMTLHSWAGIPVRQSSKAQILKGFLKAMTALDEAAISDASNVSTSDSSADTSNDSPLKTSKAILKPEPELKLELEPDEINPTIWGNKSTSSMEEKKEKDAKSKSSKNPEESEEAQIVKRWRETDLLIIDEVSMMSAEILNKLDYLGRHIRGINKPLGGLQLVLSGDFCQLPPIGTNERYCFESEVWKQAITKTFALKQIVRQSDPALQAVLNEVREGKITMAGKELLNSRLITNLSSDELDYLGLSTGVRESSERSKDTLIPFKGTQEVSESIQEGKKNKNIPKPTLIYPHRERVNDINRQRFEELVHNHEDYRVYTYTYSDTMMLKPAFKGKVRPDIPERELEEFIDQHCTAEKDLFLCVGCQVMLTVNMNLDEGLVNGLTGIISGFENGLPILCVPDPLAPNSGKMKYVKIETWTWAPDHPRYVLKRVQIPLILAWAITVHRSQGATLSSARADLKEAFGPGMAYVILSRIKTLSGLYLEGINYSKIKCDPRVLAFYKGLK